MLHSLPTSCLLCALLWFKLDTEVHVGDSARSLHVYPAYTGCAACLSADSSVGLPQLCSML